MSASELPLWMAGARGQIESELEAALSAADGPDRLGQAMRYSVLAGGKQVRPLALVMAGEACGAAREDLLPAAAAVELVHTFSLIHDDLPAMDDDDLRRGKPTLHRAFDEATALLAGDALLALALTWLASRPEAMPPERRARAIELLGGAVGAAGMIGGQLEDLSAENDWPRDPEVALESIHDGKTGALLTVSLRLGGLYAGVDGELDALLERLGNRLGLIFQIVDDILDVEGDPRQLGKAAGKDAMARKLTYPALHGLEESRRRLEILRQEAHELAAGLPRFTSRVVAFVDLLADRSH